MCLVFLKSMAENCKTCGTKLDRSYLTHCSNKCLFANLQNSESISGDPIESWDEVDPWV